MFLYRAFSLKHLSPPSEGGDFFYSSFLFNLTKLYIINPSATTAKAIESTIETLTLYSIRLSALSHSIKPLKTPCIKKYSAVFSPEKLFFPSIIAQICMYKEEFEKAAVYLDEAKRIPHKPELNVILYELEDKLERLARQELLPESCKPSIMV